MNLLSIKSNCDTGRKSNILSYATNYDPYQYENRIIYKY